MAILQRLDKWSTTHPRLLLLLRAALGIALVSKGISFINDMISFRAFLAGSNFSFLPDWITFIITRLSTYIRMQMPGVSGQIPLFTSQIQYLI